MVLKLLIIIKNKNEVLLDCKERELAQHNIAMLILIHFAPENLC